MYDGAKGRPECDGQENEECLAFKMLIAYCVHHGTDMRQTADIKAVIGGQKI